MRSIETYYTNKNNIFMCSRKTALRTEPEGAFFVTRQIYPIYSKQPQKRGFLLAFKNQSLYHNFFIFVCAVRKFSKISSLCC